MLNIAIVTNNYKPYSGGVVSSIDSYASNLRQLGYKVSIITLDFVKNDNLNEVDVFRIKCLIKFTYKNNPIAIPLRSYERLNSIIKFLKPDIVHSQHPFLLGQSALKVCKELNIPIVFTYHTRYDLYYHYIPLPKLITRSIAKKWSISYCNNIDGVIAPSESIYNFLKESKVKKPIQVIASGILPIFESNSFIEKKIKEPFHLLTVSRFVKEKNIYFLLDAFAKLDQNKFIFTLIGYGAELENLKKYVYQKLNLSIEKVKFIEKPSKEVISSFYRNTNLFIFASFTETQGLVLAEAMSCSTPVVALDATGSRDIIKNGINGFLINSIDQMTEKIIEISKDSILYKKMQMEAWRTSQFYTSKSATQNLINFYNKIISK